MPMTKDRQYRDVQFEIRKAEEGEEQSYIVEGYATTWERYELYPDTFEQFSRECFTDTDMSDIIFQYDHSGKVFARQSNGTLIVEPDDHGLHVIADLSKTAASREMYEEIKSGLVTKMSWGFIPGEYRYDKKTKTIEHRSVKKIFDVSAVSIPANNTTNIDARSFAEGVISEVVKEIEEQERKRKELELRLKLANI